MVVTLVLLLNTGVFAYSARTNGAQTSPLPLESDHESSSADSSSTQTSTHTSTQETTETTQTQSQDGQNGEQGNGNGETGNQGGQLHFTLYSPSSTNEGKDDRGQASIVIRGNTLNVDISVKKISPSTTFSVILVAIPITTTSTTTASTTTVFSTTMPSTSTISTSTTSGAASCVGSIGTFVSSGDGEGEAELSTTLNSGTYDLGLVLCSNNTPVLVSHPGTTEAVVPPAAQGNKDSESETETTTSTRTVFSTTMPSTTELSSSSGGENDQGDKVNPVTGSGQENDAITTAMSDKTIPAVISVFNSGVTLNQLDPKFSVAASHLAGNGLLISISAQNVTGSRVLLVNLTGSQWSISSLQSLKIVFDGAKISQAASLTQVLNSTSADPPSYIIMLTSSGLQLLVSIPHFSLHTIQIIPTAVPAAKSSSVNEMLLAGTLVLFAALTVAAYSLRRRSTLSSSRPTSIS